MFKSKRAELFLRPWSLKEVMNGAELAILIRPLDATLRSSLLPPVKWRTMASTNLIQSQMLILKIGLQEGRQSRRFWIVAGLTGDKNNWPVFSNLQFNQSVRLKVGQQILKRKKLGQFGNALSRNNPTLPESAKSYSDWTIPSYAD